MLKASAKLIETLDGFTVEVHWSSEGGPALDRPCTGGWGVGRQHRALAVRLVRAINAQAAHANPKVARDVNGCTYVSATALVLGRRMNADLKRLGF